MQQRRAAVSDAGPPKTSEEQAAVARRIYAAETVSPVPDVNAREAKTPPDADLHRAGFPMTDLGNAERFTDRFRDRFIHVPEWGWLWWDGRRWSREGARARVREAEHQTVRGIQDEARAVVEAGKDYQFKSGRKGEPIMYSEALAIFGRQSEQHGRLIPIAEHASAMLSVSHHELDRNRDLFNVSNGTLEVKKRQGENYVRLLPHNPGDMITKVAPVIYDPNATCPLFDSFLNQVQPDPGTQRLLLQLMGLSLTGHTREQKFVIFYGTGRNGKGVFLNTCKYISGDYADTIAVESFLNNPRGRSGGQATPDLAALPGVRLLICSEPERGAQLAEGLVKSFTGEDDIRARDLNKPFFTFRPQIKLFMQCNYRPKIKGTDEGIWNRVILIPWHTYIQPADRDPDLAQKLQAEASGILNRLLDGLCDLLDNGLVIPPTVSDAIDQYRSDSDPLGRFMDDCTRQKIGARVQSSDMHQLFLAWGRANGEAAWSAKGLSLALQERGIRKIKSDTIHWKDIELTRSVAEFQRFTDVRSGGAENIEAHDDDESSETSPSSQYREDEP